MNVENVKSMHIDLRILTLDFPLQKPGQKRVGQNRPKKGSVFGGRGEICPFPLSLGFICQQNAYTFFLNQIIVFIKYIFYLKKKFSNVSIIKLITPSNLVD